MEIKYTELIVTLMLNIVHFASSENFLSCDASTLHPCPRENEVCNVKTHQCECLGNLTLIDGQCRDPSTVTPISHGGTVAAVVIITLVLIIGGLILVVRKYNLVDHVRDRINWRRDNNIMYEDVMIGQDDPPISP